MNKTGKNRVYTTTVVIMIVTVTAIAKMIMITTMTVKSYNSNYKSIVSLPPGWHVSKHRLFPSFFSG